MSIHDEITLLALDLCVGERSQHQVCPVCNGGGSGERSLLIWCDPGRLVYRCYRVKCGASGVVGEHRGQVSSKPKAPDKKRDARQLKPEPVPSDVHEWLMEKFPWLGPDTLALHGVQWDNKRERVLLPIRSLSGTDEGWVARAYPELCLDERNKGGPKARAFFWHTIESPSCMLTPRQPKSDTLVLAEDYWSCLRLVLAGIPSIALGGTSINTAAWAELMHCGVLHIILLLDADAVAKASKLVQDYSLFFRSIRTLPLTGDDPKDLSQQDFDALTGALKEML